MKSACQTAVALARQIRLADAGEVDMTRAHSPPFRVNVKDLIGECCSITAVVDALKSALLDNYYPTTDETLHGRRRVDFTSSTCPWNKVMPVT